jgi:VWFA-related protein
MQILTPTGASAISGRTMFSVDVAPADLPVHGVTFFVDGQEACRVAVRPFQCAWDAGLKVNARNIRAVADLADGRRLVETRRTPDAPTFFSTAADAIFVPVHVFDAHDGNRVVQHLEKNDFQLLEDGVLQDISTVLVEDTPIHLFLALDVSGSMAPALAELRKSAGGFLASLRPIDAITLAAFNEHMALLAPPATDLPTAEAALARLRSTNGSTALYDAVIRAIGVLASQPGPRAIVAFTDGDDDASYSTMDAVRRALQTNDVAFYLVAQGKASDDKTLRNAWSALARETGGEAWFGPKMTDLAAHFSSVTEDLSGQYVLAYSPKKPLGDGAWRQISVGVPSRGTRYAVRAREGYLAVSRSP